MYIGFYNNTKQFNGNRMLQNPNSWLGDNLVYPFVLLAQQLQKLGHKAATIDTDSLDKFDAVVFVEFPGHNNAYFKKLVAKNKNLYLIAQESPMIKPDNLDIKNHAYFKKIFTWNDTLVDNKKYFKLNPSNKFPENPVLDNRKKEKLCAVIAGNKSAKDPNELYSERVRAIRWFEQHHPEDFDLYGIGWDRHNFSGTLLGFKLARLNRLTPLTKLLAPHFPSYKGKISSKNETYRKYQFSICYENIKGAKGYITEKIFDCFFAGCVPVYWGADNITEHIPANTFIDKRKFTTYESLYAYLKNMSEKEYVAYLEAIKRFLQSEKAFLFSAEGFAETIIKNIV